MPACATVVPRFRELLLSRLLRSSRTGCRDPCRGADSDEDDPRFVTAVAPIADRDLPLCEMELTGATLSPTTAIQRRCALPPRSLALAGAWLPKAALCMFELAFGPPPEPI